MTNDLKKLKKQIQGKKFRRKIEPNTIHMPEESPLHGKMIKTNVVEVGEKLKEITYEYVDPIPTIFKARLITDPMGEYFDYQGEQAHAQYGMVIFTDPDGQQHVVHPNDLNDEHYVEA